MFSGRRAWSARTWSTRSPRWCATPLRPSPPPSPCSSCIQPLPPAPGLVTGLSWNQIQSSNKVELTPLEPIRPLATLKTISGTLWGDNLAWRRRWIYLVIFIERGTVLDWNLLFGAQLLRECILNDLPGGEPGPAAGCGQFLSVFLVAAVAQLIQRCW